MVVAYGLILPPPVLALPRLGCVNIHGSLLPRWRGAAPIQRAILAGDAETGVTIMQLDAGLDTGPDAARARAGRSARMTRPAICTTRCPSWARRRCSKPSTGSPPERSRPRAQPADGVTYAPKIDKSEAPLDWSASAHPARPAGARLQSLAHRRDPVRRRNPARAAGAHRRAQGAHDGAPGTLLGIADDGLRVACGEGVLAVRELQRAGKRPVSARDFANAVRLAGLRFGA